MIKGEIKINDYLYIDDDLGRKYYLKVSKYHYREDTGEIFLINGIGYNIKYEKSIITLSLWINGDATVTIITNLKQITKLKLKGII